MFIPVVVPTYYGNTTVINKIIVYSNNVLKKSRVLRATVVDVKKELLKCCIRMILEENSDVVFDTIQYSYQEKKQSFILTSLFQQKNGKNTMKMQWSTWQMILILNRI